MPKRTVKDPVCGMDLKPKEIEHRSQYQGTTYYFCSATCKAQFDGNPRQYAPKEAA